MLRLSTMNHFDLSEVAIHRLPLESVLQGDLKTNKTWIITTWKSKTVVLIFEKQKLTQTILAIGFSMSINSISWCKRKYHLDHLSCELAIRVQKEGRLDQLILHFAEFPNLQKHNLKLYTTMSSSTSTFCFSNLCCD